MEFIHVASTAIIAGTFGLGFIAGHYVTKKNITIEEIETRETRKILAKRTKPWRQK